MPFEEFYAEEFAEAFNKLDKPAKEAAAKKIAKVLADPLQGKPLRGEANLYCERFLCYRIIYKIEGNLVKFTKLGKRDAVYRAG